MNDMVRIQKWLTDHQMEDVEAFVPDLFLVEPLPEEVDVIKVRDHAPAAVTALGQLVAVNAGTGEQVWDYDPRIYDYLDRPPNMGWHHRGVSYWDDAESDDARIFIASHDLRLVALTLIPN